MKKSVVLLFSMLFTTVCVLGQARIPVIMVRPGSTWCANNDCFNVVETQGKQVKVIDYTKALESMDMLASITEIEGLLQDEGLLIQNMGGATDALEEDVLVDELTMDMYGDGLEKSALDNFYDKVSADIYLDINWEIKTIGPKKQLSYVLIGKDAYTSEPVCNVTGLGEPSLAASEAQLLREAVVMKMPQLKERLSAHFETILTMGRLVTISVAVSSGSDVNLDSPAEGGNLGRAINKWLVNNAVEHRVQPGRGTSNGNSYKVRIPIYDDMGLPISAEDFAYNLSDYLASDQNVATTVQNRGLGNAMVIISGKQ